MDALTATLLFAGIYGLILALTGFKTVAAIKRRNLRQIRFAGHATWMMFAASVALPLIARLGEASINIDLRVTIPATLIGYILGIAAGAWLTPPHKSNDRSDSGSDSPVQPPSSHR
ncbi:MAG: hypothetical protein LBK99_25875 [Opitutaceae bacterium]|jgi:hypothetical protein|nr:hypothetical protein [Opitutaceae bacterium]